MSSENYIKCLDSMFILMVNSIPRFDEGGECSNDISGITFKSAVRNLQ